MRMKKYNVSRILLVIEIIVILALLAGCFRKDQLVDSFFGEDILEFTTQTEGHSEFCGDTLALTPGVYQVRIKTALSDGQSMYVQMNYENAYFKSLRNNGMTIFSNQDYADFKVYVLDKVPSAYVQCGFFGADAEALVQLEVWKTSIGNRMLLFTALVFFCVLNFLLGFRRRILDGRITVKQQVVFWTLTAGVFLVYFPYLTDYFSIGADSVFHWGRIAFLTDALQQGESLPVRLEGAWLYGHGYASSLFYGDLFLYIPALLCLIGFSIMNAYKMFVFLVLAATAVIAYHSFQKCVKDEYAALFGSMVYLMIPYHVYNVYNRGAVGEYLAMTFLPLVCCGMYLLYTEDVAENEYKKYKWYIVGGMSAILQSHLISTEMAAVLMAVFCVMFWKKTFRKQTFLQLSEAVGIVLLINAWFWLPMIKMMNSDMYHLETVLGEKGQSRGLLFAALFQLVPNVGSAQTGMWHCEPVQISAGGIMMLLVYSLWQWRKRRWNGKYDIACCVLAFFSILLLIMSTKYIPWDAISEIPGVGYIVSSLQFPSRWMSLAAVCVAMFSAFFFRWATGEGGRLVKAALGIVIILTIASAVYQVNDMAFNMSPIWLYNEENMGTVSVVNGEYLLSGTKDTDFYYHDPVAEDGLVWSEYEKKGTNVTITLDNSTDEVRHIEIPLTGYKGYGVNASEIEGEIPFITEERGAHGDLRIAVPAGYGGTISISYTGFALFHAAEAVSLLGLVIILGMYLHSRIPMVRSRFIKKEEGTE